jgi:ferrochelatase
MSQRTNKQIGVVVAQLGTPDAPTPRALRPYLKQFLSDRRVVDYPPLAWQLILHGFILPFRPARSARLYQSIWLPEGSPLLVYSKRQVAGLQERLGSDYRVVLGMRYGNPSIAQAMRTLEEEGIDRIVVLPMFPQYSCATTASIYDAVSRAALGSDPSKRFVPTLRYATPFFDHPGYVVALKSKVEEQISNLGHTPDRFVISFHGVPNRFVRTGDPYREQCEVTARLLAEAMGWDHRQWTISFQSRFGPEPWLEPYTEDVIGGLPQQGVKRPLVIVPGFAADCLETLSELGIEGREQFVVGGGKAEDYSVAPCLNDHPIWLDTLAVIVRENAQGWSR